MKECSRCLYTDEFVPGLTFDENGMCSECQKHDEMDKKYPKGEEYLAKVFEEVKRKSKGDYDCIVGLSGGCDSSYVLHLAVKHGLKPLAVTYINGWDNPIATENVKNITASLGVKTYSQVVSTEETNDLVKAFLKASVPDLEAPTDIGLTKTLYMAAEKYNIKTILNGHSYQTEGWVPKGKSYMDGAYVKDVHDIYGEFDLSTYTNLTFEDMVKYAKMGIKRVRPLYYINYIKEDAKNLLSKRYGWQWYGKHHYENVLTQWFIEYFRPLKCNFDGRIIEYSALIRSGQMKKYQAKAEIESEDIFNDSGLKAFADRLGVSENEIVEWVDKSLRPADDFNTYKEKFKKNKLKFWWYYITGKIPETFYMKYCK